MHFSSKSTIIREFIEGFKPWIEAQLGASADELVQIRLEAHLSLIDIAASHVLPGIQLIAPHHEFASAFLGRIKKVELPPNYLPSVFVEVAFEKSAPLLTRTSGWAANWLECPFALQFEGISRPIIALHIPHVIGASTDGNWREVILVRRCDAAAFLAVVQEAVVAMQQPSIHIKGMRSKSVRATGWDDLVLDPSVIKLLQTDFETFFQREAWFRQNRFPFRRGYLLHGPPGNGKTSAIRAMLSRPGVKGHTINLCHEQVDDESLSNLFGYASLTAPGIVVLEDLDRCFCISSGQRPLTKISLQHLLNCIDGATTEDGIIVVATANNPQVLDPAILRRPGRFDRVVAFTNPAKDLRTLYFKKLCPHFDSAAIAHCVDVSHGLSFAQLQEIYILAGQPAFEDDRPVTLADILSAAAALRKSLQVADWKSEGRGGFQPPTCQDSRTVSA